MRSGGVWVSTHWALWHALPRCPSGLKHCRLTICGETCELTDGAWPSASSAHWPRCTLRVGFFCISRRHADSLTTCSGQWLGDRAVPQPGRKLRKRNFFLGERMMCSSFWREQLAVSPAELVFRGKPCTLNGHLPKLVNLSLYTEMEGSVILTSN